MTVDGTDDVLVAVAGVVVVAVAVCDDEETPLSGKKGNTLATPPLPAVAVPDGLMMDGYRVDVNVDNDDVEESESSSATRILAASTRLTEPNPIAA